MRLCEERVRQLKRATAEVIHSSKTSELKGLVDLKCPPVGQLQAFSTSEYEQATGARYQFTNYAEDHRTLG